MKKLLYTLLMTCSVPLLPSSSSSSSEDKSYLKLLDASEKLRTLVLGTKTDDYHRQEFEKLLWAVAYVKADKEIDSAFTTYFHNLYDPYIDPGYSARYLVMQMAHEYKLSHQDALVCICAAQKITLPFDKAFERYVKNEELKSKLARQQDTPYNKLKRSQSF